MNDPATLRPSPLDLGGVLSGTLRILKQRLGPFAALALVPTLVAMVLVGAALVPLVLGIVRAVETGRFAGLIGLGAGLMLAAIILSYLAQIKVQAMMVLGAHDTIHGQTSSVGELFRRTAGVVGRVLLLVLLVTLAAFLVFGVLTALLVTAMIGSFATGGRSDDTMIAGFLMAYLFFLGVMVVIALVAFYLQVRFLYFLPGLSVEGLATLDSLKRSWGLTKGNVLRTLGYYLVGSLLVGAVSLIVSMLTQVATLPWSSPSSEPMTAQLWAFVPVMIITLVLQMAVQLLALPFLACYLTVMYVDQIRRDRLPQTYAGGYPGAPGDTNPYAQNLPQAPGPQQAPRPYGQPGSWNHPPQSGPNQWGPNQGDPNQSGPNQWDPNQWAPHQWGPNPDQR